MPYIKNLFEQFSKTKVLVLGDIMLDHYLSGDVDRISPEAPVPVVVAKDEYYRLGGAGNVALNLKALGLSPLICAVAGKDSAAGQLQEVLKAEAISADYLLYSEKRPTTVKTRVLSKSQQLLRIDSENSADLEAGEENALLDKIRDIFEQNKPEILILQDYDKGVLTKHVIESVTEMALKQGTFIAVDPKFRHFFNFEYADLFKPNLAELRKAFSMESLSVKQLDEYCLPLLKQQKHKNLMVTLSEKGIYWNNGKSGQQFPAKVRNIADVSGAGDTVIAVAALALYHGLSDKDICRLSNLAGGIVCESLGVVPVDPRKLVDEWQHND
ncbi:MAG: bifunctional ADP-heptose synthase [Chitinophagales bacterium]